MRFAMSANSDAGQYVQAASAATKASLNIHGTYNKYSPDYSKLVMQAAENKSNERQGAMKVAETIGKAGINAASKVANTAIGVAGSVTSNKIKTDAALSAQRTATNTGMVTGVMNNFSNNVRKAKAQKKADQRFKQQMIASMPFMKGPDLSGLLKNDYGGGSGVKGAQGTGAGGGVQAQKTDISKLTNGITSLGGGSSPMAGKLAAASQGLPQQILDAAKGSLGLYAGTPEQCANAVSAVLKKSGLNIGVTGKAWDGIESGAALASRFSGDDIGTKLTRDQLQEGDVVTWHNTYGDWKDGTITHVGLYAGNNQVFHHGKEKGLKLTSMDGLAANFAHGVRPHAYTQGSSSQTKVAKNQKASGGPSSLTFQSVSEMAKKAGASHPNLVAAQWSLESGHGTSSLATTHNNLFGQKGKGVNMSTQEDTSSGMVNTKANFKTFDSAQDSVNFLVNNWYKDSKHGSGVNRSMTASQAADNLGSQGYATDKNYPAKLKKIMEQYGG